MLAGAPAGEIIELDPDERRDERHFGDLLDPFRRSMQLLAGGVAVVTAGEVGCRVGLTATSVTSLSLAPPSLLVSVRAGSRLLPVVTRQECFTVHLLGEAQARQADVFAGRHGDDRPRTEQVEWHERAGGRLAGALAHVDCRLARVVSVFSHVLLVGVVEAVEIGTGAQPLVYFEGRYRGLAPNSTSHAGTRAEQSR